ncbi:DUF4253 domain-containing protein [soil metagenome]
MAKTILSPEEQELCKSLSFDIEIAELIKAHTGAPIGRLPAYGEDGDPLEEPGDGLCSETDEEKSYEFIDDQKDALRKEGYLIFLFEDDDEQKFLGILKGQDEFDIIKFRKTNGVNSELQTKDIINKLQVWKKKDDFFIMGVGLDWIMAGFYELPDDMDAFAKELYEFAPDVVDQSEGEISDLAGQLKDAEGFFLWWD